MSESDELIAKLSDVLSGAGTLGGALNELLEWKKYTLEKCPIKPKGHIVLKSSSSHDFSNEAHRHLFPQGKKSPAPRGYVDRLSMRKGVLCAHVFFELFSWHSCIVPVTELRPVPKKENKSCVKT